MKRGLNGVVARTTPNYLLISMQHIRSLIKDLVLEARRSKPIDRMLKRAKFKDLPIEYQISVLIYCQEGVGEIWTGIEDQSDVKNWWTDERLPQMIANYQKRKGYQSFLYGYIPTDVLIDKVDIMLKNPKNKSEISSTDFWEWHADYQKHHGVDHGPSVLPIILYRHGQGIMADEPIEDGWHRFNSYVAKGLKQIPVMMWA